jgi:hypothetical protein
MEEFDTTAGESEIPEAEERTLFSGTLLPESALGYVRRIVLLLFMGPGVVGVLWLIGRILRR